MIQFIDEHRASHGGQPICESQRTPAPSSLISSTCPNIITANLGADSSGRLWTPMDAAWRSTDQKVVRGLRGLRAPSDSAVSSRPCREASSSGVVAGSRRLTAD